MNAPTEILAPESHVFNRLNIASGNKTVGKFRPSHHPVFVHPNDYSRRALYLAEAELIAKWNAQGVNEWRYWL